VLIISKLEIEKARDTRRASNKKRDERAAKVADNDLTASTLATADDINNESRTYSVPGTQPRLSISEQKDVQAIVKDLINAVSDREISAAT
jgi:hypothetical protein